MITYTELIQFAIFIVSPVGLCHTVFKGKKQPPLLGIVTANLIKGFMLFWLFRAGLCSGFPSLPNIVYYLYHFRSAFYYIFFPPLFQ